MYGQLPPFFIANLDTLLVRLSTIITKFVSIICFFATACNLPITTTKLSALVKQIQTKKVFTSLGGLLDEQRTDKKYKTNRW